MKFTIEHTFALPPDAYVRLYFDEPFQIALCESVNLGRELVKLERTSDRVVRHVRVTPAREIPAPVAKILGGSKFQYVEELSFDMGARRGEWRTVSNILPDKVDSRGTVEMIADGAATKRVVRGDIDVKVFGIGGIVERFVVSDVEKSYADAAAFTERWIKEGRPIPA